MKMYLHTINGEPAGFNKTQLYYTGSGVGGRWVASLVKDLRTIKKQQKMSLEYRKRKFGHKGKDKYGYVIINVPDEIIKQKENKE